ncbi:MAG: type II toxin-antitoxin system HipA family toxin [Proteobacteria bacterium]|nr:type II toxin-antitoxin system HipA family toxin [Pseudomonadota bacterium]MBU1058815.1 type II toxin-antitoxin system HipA family toxin [Pseudomonadota bacterium]
MEKKGTVEEMTEPEISLYVYGLFPNNEVIEIGRLLSRNLHSRLQFEGFFRYSPSYLQHPLAYAIDPVHLPLDSQTFSANNKETGIHQVFDDSLPDAWGRHILARRGALDHSRYAPAHLLAVLGGSGLGRLLYSPQEKTPAPVDGSIPFSDIAKAIDEAGKLEDSFDTETAELQHLLACGSSAGGARPKVLTLKDNTHWIAKFSSRRDIHPTLMIALEEAGLTLARNGGLDVPEFCRVLAGDRDVLLIKRFDIVPRGGRNGLVSMRTLIGTEDHYSVSYADLAGIIRSLSHQVQKDLEHLLRQMVVNVLLVNTDDHLQNFAMLHTAEGWRLSPAYDIVPNIHQTGQILQVNGKHTNIESKDIIREGTTFGLSYQKSKAILKDVCGRVGDWSQVFTEKDVPLAHTGKLKAEITQRFQQLSL